MIFVKHKERAKMEQLLEENERLKKVNEGLKEKIKRHERRIVTCPNKKI